MDPMQIQFQRELLAFEAKIDLAELEVAKAQERVAELKYERSRFREEAFVHGQQQAQPVPQEENKKQ